MADRRYARHVSLPEIGAAGQERLAHAQLGDVLNRTTLDYLRRAGVPTGRTAATEAQSETDVIRGAFEAVEEMKRILGVGTPGKLGPEELA